ncbi:MAG: type II toxin-antitoxin system RelE/ParE family toxin [Sphingobacteriales bacterium]|nr:type II toxin-antitoxin system RelE/ParE family toxin [Sphingobacteriales bacterium]
MAEIKFTVQAIDDLADIAAYISKESVYYAGLQIEKLIGRTDILTDFPKIGRVVPELNVKSIREIIEGNYRIVYRIVNKELIHILTFHHSKRRFRRSAVRRIIKKSK